MRREGGGERERGGERRETKKEREHIEYLGIWVINNGNLEGNDGK